MGKKSDEKEDDDKGFLNLLVQSLAKNGLTIAALCIPATLWIYRVPSEELVEINRSFRIFLSTYNGLLFLIPSILLLGFVFYHRSQIAALQKEVDRNAEEKTKWEERILGDKVKSSKTALRSPAKGRRS